MDLSIFCSPATTSVVFTRPKEGSAISPRPSQTLVRNLSELVLQSMIVRRFPRSVQSREMVWRLNTRVLRRAMGQGLKCNGILYRRPHARRTKEVSKREV